MGITGSSGSGKSLAREFFCEHGWFGIDADAFAKEVVGSSEIAKKQLGQAFGADVIKADGSIDNALLAGRSFASKEGAVALDKITHPLILKEVTKKIAALEADRVDRCVLDAPLLFESGADRLCSKTLCVIADRQTLIRRILERDGITKERAVSRLDAQREPEYYSNRADYTVYNNCDIESFFEQLERILGEHIEI